MVGLQSKKNVLLPGAMEAKNKIKKRRKKNQRKALSLAHLLSNTKANCSKLIHITKFYTSSQLQAAKVTTAGFARYLGF